MAGSAAIVRTEDQKEGVAAIPAHALALAHALARDLETSSLAAARLALGRIRVNGGVRARFVRDGERTRGMALGEADGYRLRFPDRSAPCEAVIMNTGGGVAGGDQVAIAMRLDNAAIASATSVGAERIYRSNGAVSAINLEISLGDDAQFLWLPHETILFDGAKLCRRIEADLALSAQLTLVDFLVFGRRGAGETINDGLIHDRWEFRRDGILIHAEALRLEGAIDAQLGHPASGNGAHQFGTIIHIARDCEAKLPMIRAALAGFSTIEIAASTWNGKLVIRAQATSLPPMRAAFAAILPILSGRPTPRGWADE